MFFSTLVSKVCLVVNLVVCLVFRNYSRFFATFLCSERVRGRFGSLPMGDQLKRSSQALTAFNSSPGKKAATQGHQVEVLPGTNSLRLKPPRTKHTGWFSTFLQARAKNTYVFLALGPRNLKNTYVFLMFGNENPKNTYVFVRNTHVFLFFST